MEGWKGERMERVTEEGKKKKGNTSGRSKWGLTTKSARKSLKNL